jgi:hypothetical protein
METPTKIWFTVTAFQWNVLDAATLERQESTTA